MKLITLLLSLVLISPALAGLPPTTLNSQQSSVKNTTFNAYVPNNQATKITGGTLIESGNKNLLANPSFESPLVGGVIPSWNFGALAPILEISSTVIDGKQLALFNASAQAVLLTQTSTLYASAFALGGTQGLATCRINSTAALKMCTISNSGTSTSNCVDINADGNWGLYKIPVILGTGNNGLSIASTGAVTGTVYVDDCFLGAQDLTQNITACQTADCTTEFSFKGSLTGVVSEENIDFINGSGVYSAGLYTYTFNTPMTTAPNCSTGQHAASGTTIRRCLINSTSTTNVRVACLNDFTGIQIAHQVVCQRAGDDYIAALSRSNGNTYSTPADTFSTDTNTLTHKATAIVDSDPIGTYNTYSYAANSNTKTICATAPSVAPTKADGFKIFTRAYNVASTCGNPARVEIKLANAGTSLPTLSKEIYKNTGKNVGGSLDATNNGASTKVVGANIKIYEQNTGVLTIDAAYQKNTTFTSAVLDFADSTEGTSGYLVINAQKAKEFIIGDFDGLEKCADSYECTDTFSAKVSTTDVVSDENIDWIDGNCTNAVAGRGTCTFKLGVFTAAPNCVLVSNNFTAFILGAISETDLTYEVRNSSGVGIDAVVSIMCQKAGADYKPKTAKIANPEALNYVYVEAAENAGQAITANVTNIPFIEITDTHNAWNGSTFTVPMDGVYTIKSSVIYTADSNKSTDLFVNGSVVRRMNYQLNGVSAAMQASYTGKFNQDEVVSLRLGGVASRVLSNSTQNHYLTITRIPGQF